MLHDSYRNTRSYGLSSTSGGGGDSLPPPPSTSGACLGEALERYKRYEQKLNDQVRPNDETLKKLNSSPSVQSYLQHKQQLQQQQQHVKSNFQAFPNGNNYAAQAFEDLAAPSSCGDGGTMASTIDKSRASRGVKSANVPANNRQLPAINRLASAKFNKPTSAKSVNNKSI